MHAEQEELLTPGRRSVAACALIRRHQDGETVWLTQWNQKWGCYHLVGGHKRPDESFRECLVREIGEELGLQEDDGSVSVAAEPAAHLEYTAWSASARQPTLYITELFHVQLSADAAHQKVDHNSLNRWITDSEIRLRRCVNGQSISEALVRLLSHLDPTLKPDDLQTE
jgi:8-oxo-dGTP pyrophosphatase MutT (NUDIX family)